VPIEYCVPLSLNLRANGSSLDVLYKIKRGYIRNQNYYFKNIFTVVKNITNDIILGILFLTQICLFYIDKNGVHTKVLDQVITFAFISSTKQQELSRLQKSSIFTQINAIQIEKRIPNIFIKGFTVSTPYFDEYW